MISVFFLVGFFFRLDGWCSFGSCPYVFTSDYSVYENSPALPHSGGEPGAVRPAQVRRMGQRRWMMRSKGGIIRSTRRQSEADKLDDESALLGFCLVWFHGLNSLNTSLHLVKTGADGKETDSLRSVICTIASRGICSRLGVLEGVTWLSFWKLHLGARETRERTVTQHVAKPRLHCLAPYEMPLGVSLIA